MAIFPPLHHLQSVIPLPTPHPLLSRPVLSVVLSNRVANPEISGFQRYSLFVPIIFPLFRAKKINASSLRCFHKESQKSLLVTSTVKEKMVKKMGKREHHVWQKRDSAGSGHKALSLLSILRDLPNEKEAVYGALDKWTAWETEFPLVAASKALKILRRRRQWTRVIQVSKWMLSKGQGATMGTYGTLLLAFDMDQRVDEAESLWNMILHTHTRSISKQLFSRMISLYDHHDMPNKIIEVFADMEELGVRPDEDTVRRVARGFQKLGQEEKQKMVLKRYLSKYKYVHFRGERVRVKRYGWEQESMRKCFIG